MFLHELSDDVLRLIISELDTDTGKNDLISLALTCRRLSQFARHAITRNVKLIMPSRQFELPLPRGRIGENFVDDRSYFRGLNGAIPARASSSAFSFASLPAWPLTQCHVT